MTPISIKTDKKLDNLSNLDSSFSIISDEEQILKSESEDNILEIETKERLRLIKN